MPLLNRRSLNESAIDETCLNSATLTGVKSSSLIGHCSNPACRTPWLQLFRPRTRPIFESGWTCSRECTEVQLRLAVRRELDGRVQAQETHRHRIPLGLLMLEKGWITPQQLRRAVETQRRSGVLRIGEWLVRHGATDEDLVTRALGMQWGCPVLSLRNRGMTGKQLFPRLFIDAFGALPVQGSSGRILYLGFEQSVDPALAFSLERIEGARVECGIVQSSEYRNLLHATDNRSFPSIQMAEATSDFAAAHTLAKSIERAGPMSSRLVRVHEWLWLRMVLGSSALHDPGGAYISDVLCRIRI